MRKLNRYPLVQCIGKVRIKSDVLGERAFREHSSGVVGLPSLHGLRRDPFGPAIGRSFRNSLRSGPESGQFRLSSGLSPRWAPHCSVQFRSGSPHNPRSPRCGSSCAYIGETRKASSQKRREFRSRRGEEAPVYWLWLGRRANPCDRKATF